MGRKASQNFQSSVPSRSGSNGLQGTLSPETELLEKVQMLLDKEQPQKALDLIRSSKLQSLPLTNARAVCLLRMGKAKEVVEMLRPHVVTDVRLRPEAPSAFKTNFATALLLSGNISGCIRILDEMHEEDNPAVQKLRYAIGQWRKSLSFLQKLRWYCGDEPQVPIKLDFQPGNL